MRVSAIVSTPEVPRIERVRPAEARAVANGGNPVVHDERLPPKKQRRRDKGPARPAAARSSIAVQSMLLDLKVGG